MSFLKTRMRNVYEHAESGIYHLRIRRKGKRPFNKSLDTKNFKVAQALADELIREYLGQSPKRREHVLFKDACEKFLRAFEMRVKPGTHMRTKSVLNLYLLPYWQNRIITEITAGEWAEYIRHEMGKRKRNLSNDKKAMSNVLHFCMNEGMLDGVPKLTDPSKPSEVGREITEQEWAALYLAAQANEEVLLGAMIAYSVGCRIGEVVSIPWKKVHEQQGWMEVSGKTGPRRVAFGKQLAAHLQAQRIMATSPWVFPLKTDSSRHMSTNQFDKDWQEIKRRAFVSCRFHDLRHTYITNALRAGHSIVKVAKQVGSSVRTITKVYEHLNIQDLTDLGEVMKLDGRSGNIGVKTVQTEK